MNYKQPYQQTKQFPLRWLGATNKEYSNLKSIILNLK